jgi:hypothetical protein
MRLTDEELKKLYQEQTTSSAQNRSGCLSEEELLKVAIGEVSQSERERMADHLLTCSDCTQEYRITLSLKPLSEQLADFSKAGDQRLKIENDISKIEDRFRARVFPAARVLYTIAASLLLVSLGLGIWIASLRRQNQFIVDQMNEQIAERDRSIKAAEESLAQARRQIENSSSEQPEKYKTELAELRKINEELSRPRANIPIIDLDPSSSTRGEASQTSVVRVPSGSNFFVLILNSTDEKSHSDHQIEILDQRGKLIWQESRVRKSSSNNFTIELSQQLFPAGKYRIRLHGLNRGKRELIEDYTIKILYQK